MVSTHEVYCKDCRKKIAWWSMWDNLQFEEEWECDARVRRPVEGKAWRSKDGKHILYANQPDDESPYPLKTQMRYCCIKYKTVYCRKCAERRHFHCGRPRCKGHLVKTRNKDGTVPKEARTH